MAALDDLVGVTTKHLEELISCSTPELEALADQELMDRFADIFKLEPPVIEDDEDDEEESIIETVTEPTKAAAKKSKRLSAKERKLAEIAEFKKILIELENLGAKPTQPPIT